MYNLGSVAIVSAAVTVIVCCVISPTVRKEFMQLIGFGLRKPAKPNPDPELGEETVRDLPDAKHVRDMPGAKHI